MNIEKFIFESFAYNKLDKKSKDNKDTEYCKKADAFVQSLDEKQQKDFAEIEEMFYDLQYNEEMQLIRFVLDILRGMFGREK